MFYPTLLYLKRIHSKMSATVDRGQLMESSKRRQKFAKKKTVSGY